MSLVVIFRSINVITSHSYTLQKLLLTFILFLFFFFSFVLSPTQPPIELQGHIQWASAIVLVYDVTDRHSFNSINKLISVVSSCRSNFLPVALVGNKQDLEFGRQVDTSEGRNLATKYNFYFFEVSTCLLKIQCTHCNGFHFAKNLVRCGHPSLPVEGERERVNGVYMCKVQHLANYNLWLP